MLNTLSIFNRAEDSIQSSLKRLFTLQQKGNVVSAFLLCQKLFYTDFLPTLGLENSLAAFHILYSRIFRLERAVASV
jgi:hypothetical protein